jgi:immune inhibitor A
MHEMSRCMGLPDLYATQSQGKVNNQGMESWSIMDYGLYNRNGFAPAAYTAWEQKVMGWTEIEDVGSMMVDGQCQLSDVLPLIEGGKAYKLQNPDNDRNYIVLENVQKRGLNQYANGHGLLVYQVDYPNSSVGMSDSPNNNPGHPSVAVVPAGGELINAYLRGKDKLYTVAQWRESLAASVFPGTKVVTSLTDNMLLPNYCFWNGSTAKETGFMLNSLSENEEAGTVSFNVAIDDPTGVMNLTQTLPTAGGKIYDLQGCEVRTLTKGVYIVNGRKVVIK